nr:unnamed protein product [Digitaria exilis]
MMAELDSPLHALGFEIDELSPARVTGRLLVTAICCQPFKVLHGGVSALVAEALASMGAHMASGYKRVAGMQLSINHFRIANLGDTVLARAVPVHVGRSTQVRPLSPRLVACPAYPSNPILVAIAISMTPSHRPDGPHDQLVWEVKLWKMDPSTGEKGPQIAESRVTLLSNLPLPEEHKNAGAALRKYASKL